MLVVVPARGRSLRVPRKNIAPLAGKPLLLWTLETVLAANVEAQVVVSTDDDTIATVAAEAGVAVLKRPSQLATDMSSTEGVLLHALDVEDLEGRTHEWVVTLSPTSPLRSAATVSRFIAMLPDAPDDVDCLLSVHEDRGDFWVRDGDDWRRLAPNAPRRQQDRAPLYVENSAIYATRVPALRRTGSILGARPRGVVIDAIEGHDINTPEDLLTAEAILLARRDP